ncbi:MAG: AAA family ATPase, partial [Clostridia bacterium]
MIVRPRYLDILRTYRNVPLVKILAGIRRSGKSTILEMLGEELVSSGIPRDHIISRRYTSESFEDGMTSKKMYQEIKAKITDASWYYLLLDEVQEIDGWERAVNSLLEDAHTDIYVTGSNSKLMSGEISTYLTGRYISIPVYTLSFAEYLTFKKSSKLSEKELLNEYIRMGGFPLVASGNFDERSSHQIVEGIYNSVITSDIVKRHQVKDFDLFSRVVKYVVEN